MSGDSLTLRKVDGSMVSYVETLLEENGLPTAHVREKTERFYVGYDEDERVGVGGLERHGHDGLLRSLVVERSARGNGFGTAICEALEATARADGIETVYLLTTTASGFFDARGYAQIDRSEAPASIRETTEFADLCPSTATCMRKSL